MRSLGDIAPTWPTSDAGIDLPRSWRRAISHMAKDPVTRCIFVLSALLVAFAYSVLLPYDYTQRVSLRNWQYLNVSSTAWAVVLGLAMAVVLSVQVYAMRTITAARASTGVSGGFAFVGSLLPSFLCCTPIIPTVLAFVGVSGVGLYSTTGTLQHFFATHQTEFLLASLALLVFSSWWGIRKVATAVCLSPSGPDGASSCGVRPAHEAQPASPKASK